MAKKTKPNGRRRKPRTSKRLENSAQTPGERREMAIDYAIAFLRLALAQQRAAFASRVQEAASLDIEDRLDSMISSVEPIEAFASSPPDAQLVKDVDLEMARNTEWIFSAIPVGFFHAQQRRTFRVLESGLSKQRQAPTSLPPKKWAAQDQLNRLPQGSDKWTSKEKTQFLEERYSFRASLARELQSDRLALKQARIFQRLTEGPISPHDVKSYAETGTRLQEIAGPLQFPSATKVREEIGKRMGLSRGTVLKLATGKTQKTPLNKQHSRSPK